MGFKTSSTAQARLPCLAGQLLSLLGTRKIMRTMTTARVVVIEAVLLWAGLKTVGPATAENRIGRTGSSSIKRTEVISVRGSKLCIAAAVAARMNLAR
jgi:hypothetical protein